MFNVMTVAEGILGLCVVPRIAVW